MQKTSIIVTGPESGQELFKYLKKILKLAPLNFIYRLLRKKDVRVNGVKADSALILEEGDIVEIFLTTEQAEEFLVPYTFLRFKPTFDIIYEDENILVVDKPAGLLVHPTVNEKEKTLSNMVLTYLEEKGEFKVGNRGFIPSPVARIDEDTSGIVLFSKRMNVHQVLANAFTSKYSVNRFYRLVVYGIVIKDDGEINIPLLKEGGMVIPNELGKEAITHFHVLKRGFQKTYLEASILTGRQHQIRVHFATLGHPIVGDKKYGKDTGDLALNAYSLTFNDLPEPLAYLNGKVLIADHTKKLLNVLGGKDEKY